MKLGDQAIHGRAGTAYPVPRAELGSGLVSQWLIQPADGAPPAIGLLVIGDSLMLAADATGLRRVQPDEGADTGYALAVLRIDGEEQAQRMLTERLNPGEDLAGYAACTLPLASNKRVKSFMTNLARIAVHGQVPLRPTDAGDIKVWKSVVHMLCDLEGPRLN